MHRLALLIFLAGCRPIDAYLLPLNEQSYASHHVHTPDGEELLCGKRLVVHWNGKTPCTHISLDLLFRDWTTDVCCYEGSFVYETERPLLAYRIQVYSGEALLAVEQHPLWVELQ